MVLSDANYRGLHKLIEDNSLSNLLVKMAVDYCHNQLITN